MSSDADARLMRSQNRFGWRVAIVCGLASAVLLGLAIYSHGRVLGIRPALLWRLPFFIGIGSMLVYFVVAALRTGCVAFNYRVIHRSERPLAFNLTVVFLAALSIFMIGLAAVMLYFDLRSGAANNRWRGP